MKIAASCTSPLWLLTTGMLWPGIIDKELFPRAVGLPHDQIELARPGAIGLAKPAVLEALGRGRLVFLPEQEQGDAFAFEFAVDRGPVGHQVRRRGLAEAAGNSSRSSVASS